MGWALAIDFGTSFTVAAIRRESGVVQMLPLDGGTTQLRSCVLFNGDRLLVGREAANAALASPQGYVGAPKRLIDQTVPLDLGDRAFGVVELIGAVLERVLAVAARVADGPPERLWLTHPADWLSDAGRLGTLGRAGRAALQSVGWPEVAIEFVAEPVAAAVGEAAARDVAIGDCLAVYDLGGGTFDAAVVRRTADRFEVVGAAEGMLIGGEAFDDVVVEQLGGALDADDRWELLSDPLALEEAVATAALEPSRASIWRAGAITLREHVRDAKELLSGSEYQTIDVPVLDRPVQLGIEQFEGWIAPLVHETVAVMREQVDRARAQLSDGARLEQVVLVGGSSFIPLVQRLVTQGTGLRATAAPDRKGIVALGAVTELPRPPEPGPGPGPGPARAEREEVTGDGAPEGALPPALARADVLRHRDRAQAVALYERQLEGDDPAVVLGARLGLAGLLLAEDPDRAAGLIRATGGFATEPGVWTASATEPQAGVWRTLATRVAKRWPADLHTPFVKPALMRAFRLDLAQAPRRGPLDPQRPGAWALHELPTIAREDLHNGDLNSHWRARNARLVRTHLDNVYDLLEAQLEAGRVEFGLRDERPVAVSGILLPRNRMGVGRPQGINLLLTTHRLFALRCPWPVVQRATTRAAPTELLGAWPLSTVESFTAKWRAGDSMVAGLLLIPEIAGLHLTVEITQAGAVRAQRHRFLEWRHESAESVVITGALERYLRARALDATAPGATAP